MNSRRIPNEANEDKVAAKKKSSRKNKAASSPTLSVAMIVKDEEKLLPNALASVKPWVDEIVVVDTGSKDKTVEIASSFGAKLYHHLWEYDFAKHRNQSISYCAMDWVLILDADEEIDQATAPLMRQALQKVGPEVGCIYFDAYNIMPDGSRDLLRRPSIFRNTPEFGYRGKVHNEPSYQGVSLKTPIKLLHYGYGLPAGEMEQKNARRLEMIRRWVEQEPGNWRSQYHFAQTLVSKPETAARAAQAALTALELARKGQEKKHTLSNIYLILLQALTQDYGNDELILRHGRDWADLAPDLPDPLLFMARTHYAHKRWAEAKAASRQYAVLAAKAPGNPNLAELNINTITLLYSGLAIWAVSAAALGNGQEAMAVLTEIYKLPNAEQVVKLVANEAQAKGLEQAAQAFAQQAAQDRPEWKWPAAFLQSAPPAQNPPGAITW